MEMFCLTFLLMLVAPNFTTADQVHRVQPRETLSIIAKNYQVSVDSLLRKNRYIRNANNIIPGQILVIPRNSYVVQSGDSLFKISQKVGRSMSLLIEANHLTNINELYVGQRLIIPDTYTVKSGDSLYKISSKSGIRMEFLAEENNLDNINSLSVGQKLYLPENDDWVYLERYLTPVANQYPQAFYFKGPATVPKIALTFDDGPHPIYTDQILNILNSYNIKATFFLLGSNLKGRQEQVKRLVSEGHTIGSHTWSHPDIRNLSESQLHNELKQFDQVLKEITGLRSTLFRPPYGFYTEDNILSLYQQNYHLIKWSVDSFDWRDKSVDNIFLNIIPGVRAGSIILFHDTISSETKQSLTVQLLPELIKTLQGQGYNFVTVDEMVGVNPYH
jgi:peptidoglycan-N-acetylglucosamine deacetylase